MKRKTQAAQRITWTTKVTGALLEQNDFMRADQLAHKTGGTMNQISAAIHHLAFHKAIDSVLSNGTLWWFLTPDTDDRVREVELRTPEEKKRRTRVHNQSINAPIDGDA